MSYNDKELFDLLAEEEEKSSDKGLPKDRQNKDVLRFIRKFGIAPGPNKVPTYVIYYHFKLWYRTIWGRFWKKEEFFRTFKRHFEQKRNGNQRFYMINDSLDLSDELYEKAKKYDAKYEKRKKRKKSEK